MGKKDKGDILDDYKKLKDEIIIDKVNEIFRSRSDNYIAALEEIGFEYHEEDDEEEIEEREAKPKNKNQRKLVTYLEGEEDASETIFATFLTERYAKRPYLHLIVVPQTEDSLWLAIGEAHPPFKVSLNTLRFHQILRPNESIHTFLLFSPINIIS